MPRPLAICKRRAIPVAERARICPSWGARARGGYNFASRGNNRVMREPGKGIAGTKAGVERLIGMPLVMKVNEGRGRTGMFRGQVIAVFPAVFTVRTESGEIRTFSYSDVHTRGIMFLRDCDSSL